MIQIGLVLRSNNRANQSLVGGEPEKWPQNAAAQVVVGRLTEILRHL